MKPKLYLKNADLGKKNWLVIKYKTSSSYIYKVNKETITFGSIKIEKRKFHYSKYPININTVDIDKIIRSSKVTFRTNRFKYFTGYKDDEKVKPLCILFLKLRRYTKSFDETKCMPFLIEIETI